MKLVQRAALSLFAGAIVVAALAVPVTAGAATIAPAAPRAHAAKTLTWPVTKPGAKGERVFAIQYLLNARIAAGLAVDGKYGPKTEAAVKAFQKKVKIHVDGIVGPVTWPKLIITVKEGSKGPAVSAVQHNLRYAYGFTKLAVDGIFGAKTKAAVKTFQKKWKIGVDGIVGPVTWNTLIVHEK
jgi:peptidoglycan hydrolase-like protein with peptidoglycan-binding domain